MTRPTRPLCASDWRTELENAVRRQVAAERFAEGLEGRQLTHPFQEELRNARRAAALAEAEAWSAYAVRCSEAFESASEHEARRRRYETDGAA